MPDLLIHSRIASLGAWRGRRDHSAVLLWYYSRGIDSDGSGKATFDLRQAASDLGKSEATIRRLIRLGIKGGLFRSVQVEQNICTIYLTSRDKLALTLGLNSFGTSVKLQLFQLSNLRFYCYEGEVKAASFRGHCAAKTPLQRESVKMTETVVLNSLKCAGSTGQRIFLFLNSFYTAYGSSQATVAKVLQVSERTINRNLSSAQRAKACLDPISRVQILITDPTYSALYLSRCRDAIASAKLLHPPGSSRVYRCYPCIYDSHLWLRPQRTARRKYKFLLSQNPPIFGSRGADSGHLKNLSEGETHSRDWGRTL